MKTFNDLKPQVLAKVGLFLILLAGINYSTYSWLINHDWPREDYNYCYLIPLVIIYLIWEKKDEFVAEPAVSSWGGLLLLVPGVLLFWVGDLAGELYSLYFSSWFAAVGILWMQIGWRKLKVILFPLFIALTMFPPPNFLNTKLTFGLRLISSKIGVALIQLYGMSAYREGNVIDLGFTQLQVVDACSGLRYLFPLLIMGILFSYYYRGALWKRLVLVLSTIPLTILVNSLRIALTGIIYAHLGASVAEGFFHGFSGLLIFMVSFAVLLAEIWVLRRIAPGPTESFFGKHQSKLIAERRDELKANGSEVKEEEKEGLEAGKPGSWEARKVGSWEAGKLGSWEALLSPPQFIVAVIMLAGTLALAQGVEFREKTPAGKPFSQFPLAVGAWDGTRQYMEQKFITELDLSDYTMIDFKSGDGKRVDFYVAYCESQRKGESIHSPETCLPGSGWEFKQAGKAQVALRNPHPVMKVNRAIMEKSGYRQISYFWFPMRGRILTNAYEMKLYTLWDALTRQRTEGALVRLITPIYESEEVADAEQRLQFFTRDIVPILEEFIPN